ncbi:MAG TPA: phosphoribosylanthranilate isomerase [Methylomirabilota bacterium]|nr:phosphoribosylanthranilate isomerase [Methylomirabilota bacterium]
MVRVKICGVTSWADARAACDAGADALGFNFYEKSPRRVAPAEAWSIIRRLPAFVAPVGVFVNWAPRAVVTLARALRLAAAQLHGDESPRDVAACAREVFVIKAFRTGPRFRPAEMSRYGAASAFLLDAAKAGQFGGTGARADWTVAQRAARTRLIILSGGLSPENVAEAVRIVRPYAVDVASGVESRPGKKDPRKLRAFLAEVSSGAAAPRGKD